MYMHGDILLFGRSSSAHYSIMPCILSQKKTFAAGLLHHLRSSYLDTIHSI
jgi:hypothetical protein